jgi:hypothetical protein
MRRDARAATPIDRRDVRAGAAVRIVAGGAGIVTAV